MLDDLMVAARGFCLLVLGASPAAYAQSDNLGAQLFARDCAICHVADSATRAPTRESMAGLAPEAVMSSLQSGRMVEQAAQLSRREQAAVAEYLTGRAPATTGIARAHCTAGDDSLGQSMTGLATWNGWGAGEANARFQTADRAQLTADQLPQLDLLWAFGFADALAARAQPTVIGRWLLAASETGEVLALDALNGCLRWAFRAEAAVRTAVRIEPVAANNGQTRYIALFGDGQANAYGVDAETGERLWIRALDDHPYAVITGSPAVHAGRVYLPTSASGEEVRGQDPTYACCTFRGSVSALEITTGELIFKRYAIDAGLERRGSSSAGEPLFGPAGAGIWGSPTIDAERGLLYVGTGNAYSGPPQPTSNAILAIDLDSGEIVWSQQTTPADIWLWQCETAANATNPNCPETQGPDFDFGASPMLTTTPSGRDLIVVPQKSGVLYALDPDAAGQIVWQYRFGQGSALGGQWGAATDGRLVYIGVADPGLDTAGGIHAVDLETGTRRWIAPARPPLCSVSADANCYAAQGGALTATPGFVLSGGSDGGLRAYSSIDGALLWEYDTNRSFETVNGVSARGATIDAAGPVIAGGRVYVNSGYNGIVGRPGNVMLAFGLPAQEERQ